MAGKAQFSVEELRTAIAGGQLFLEYQPQMLSDGTRMVGVEALVRWRHPARGIVSPAQFIQVAERTGLIRELGAWVLRQACRDGVAWPGLVVGVNVSPLQFREPDVVNMVRTVADAAGMPLDRIELEVTEGAYFDDVERARVELKRLRALGVQIALDDFGTGYASLTYLRKLPFTKVKIDKSFVDDCQSVGAAAIIHAVVAMSRALGLKVTAEGVETEEQQRFLRAAGCHYLQGYLFSRPVPAHEITRRLQAAAATAGA